MDAMPASAADKMDRQYRFQRHIYDATRTHYLAWRRRLVAELKPANGDRVVEVACGTGWNIVRAARRYPDARFYGFDISAEMLITAARSVERSGLKGRVQLAKGDATNFALPQLFGIAHADRIFISYALSMIPDWPLAVERATRHLAPGGALSIVDFGAMDAMPAMPRTAFRAFLAHYNVTPRPDLKAVLDDVARRDGLQLTFETAPLGYANYAVLSRP